MTREIQIGSHLAQRTAALPPPVVIFNKSHSGSRLLARFAQDQNIFIGAQLNESLDALPFLPLIEHVVGSQYPAFHVLRQAREWPRDLLHLIDTALDAHLVGHRTAQPWGWKLCETTYILPLIATLFPDARFVHLIRDGRDVAFADHVAPELPFWRRVYFGTDAIASWRGMPLDHPAYLRASYLYNAQHWQESVRLGRDYGVMLGTAYREIFYEELCRHPERVGREFIEFLGLSVDDAALAATARAARTSAVGKFKSQPRRRQRRVQRLIEPTLLAFGYHCDPLPPTAPHRLWGWLSRMAHGVERRLFRV
jgi:hypothetical protein